MSDGKYPALLGLAVILSLIGLLLMAGAPAPSYALPGRDTPTPVLRDDDSDDDQPVGAYIELHVQGAPTGAWAVVQWQRSAGDWHDVEGWQGTLQTRLSRALKHDPTLAYPPGLGGCFRQYRSPVDFHKKSWYNSDEHTVIAIAEPNRTY